MEMKYEDFAVLELRAAARILVPDARGAGGIAHVGNKEQLIAFLSGRGILPGEIKEVVLREEERKRHEDEKKKQSSEPNGDLPRLTGQPTVPPLPSTTEQPTSSTAPAPVVNRSGSSQPKGTEGDELALLRKIILKDASPEIDRGEIEAMVNDKIGSLKSEMISGLSAAVEEIKRSSVQTVQIITPEGEKRDIGVTHKATPTIIKVCNAGVHVMLVGAAGGGKTTTCEKVAEALGLEFFPMSVGPQTTKSDLLGFIDAAGGYHTTPLRRAFEKGGLLLLDEVDAANAGVLTIINAMLANGYCSFPDGVIKRHDNFRCVCACNTYGRGADREYVGRNQLDAATLDRFAVIDFDYDEELEKALAGNDNWVSYVQRLRQKAQEIKARVVISPRASIYGAKLLAAGMTTDEVAEMVIWKGIPGDLRRKIESA